MLTVRTGIEITLRLSACSEKVSGGSTLRSLNGSLLTSPATRAWHAQPWRAADAAGNRSGWPSGGYTEIRFGEDLGAAFARVADELHSQYLIGFAPPTRDGKVHDVDVRVTQRGLKPRSQKSYVAPKE